MLGDNSRWAQFTQAYMQLLRAISHFRKTDLEDRLANPSRFAEFLRLFCHNGQEERRMRGRFSL